MKTLKIIKYLFSIIGLGMLVGAFFFFQHTQDFLKTAVSAEGKVIDLVRSRSSDSTVYKPVVKFTTLTGEQVQFTSSTGSNPASYSRGETVEVLYQETSPTKAKINGFFSVWGGTLIFSILGAVFFLVGFSIFLFGYLKNKKDEYLKTYGSPIFTKFESVGLNESFTVNGRHPYQVTTQWKNPQTNQLHIFKSDNIWFDPTDHINTEDIVVLIDKKNPKKYFMDISFLPEVAK